MLDWSKATQVNNLDFSNLTKYRKSFITPILVDHDMLSHFDTVVELRNSIFYALVSPPSVLEMEMEMEKKGDVL